MRAPALLIPLSFLVTIAASGTASAQQSAAAEPALSDLAFLEGRWRGGDEGFVFEETWNSAEGGVMTGMARGVRGGELAVLEYIVVSEEEDGVFMRFKHFRADYSTWEDDEPLTLRFTQAKEGDVIFHSDDPQSEVQTIRYFLTGDDGMQADVALMENGEPGGFSLTFTRAE